MYSQNKNVCSDPCDDKSKGVSNFSDWNYFKDHPVKIVSRKSCGGWNPELLRRMREPLKPIEVKPKAPATPRKTRAILLREKFRALEDRDSDCDAMSASTESLVPRPRTPKNRITAEELHQQLVAKQDEEFRAQLASMKQPSKEQSES